MLQSLTFVLLGKLSVSYNLAQAINLPSQAYINMSAQLHAVSFNSIQSGSKTITLTKSGVYYLCLSLSNP